METVRIYRYLLFGVAVIISFYIIYWLYPKLHPLSLTDFRISKDQAVQEALKYLENDFSEEELKIVAGFTIEKGYLQDRKRITEKTAGAVVESPKKFWEIEMIPKKDIKFPPNWTASNEGTKPTKKFEKEYLALISPQGRLLKLDFESPRLALIAVTGKDSIQRVITSEMTQSEAFLRAGKFLHELGIDTSELTVTNRQIREDSLGIKYEYTFSEVKSDMPVLHTLKLSGYKILFYEYTLKPEPVSASFEKIEKISDVGFTVFEVVIFMLLIIVMIVYLFRFSRMESISFKMAIPMVILICSLTIINSIAEAWHQTIWATLVQVFFTGLISGAGILFLYAVSDALARRNWSEKLVITDMFHQGFFFNSTVGRATLRGFALGVLALASYAAVLYLDINILGDEVILKERINYSLYTTFPALLIIAGSISSTIFHEYFFRLLGLSILKSWIRNKTWLIIAGAGIGLFFSVDIVPVHPASRFFAFAIPAIIFSYFLVRHEIFTILTGYFFFIVLAKAVIFHQSGNELFYNIGWGLYIGAALLLLIGITAAFVKREVSEQPTRFVPDYVRKGEEKERLIRELEIARSVQMKFLPTYTPQLPNFDIAAICQPAWEVGGDYYDFFRMKDDRLGIVVGDVSNKGISAAFYMTLVKGFLKSLCRQYQDPVGILTETNSLFYQSVERGHFISMIFGILDIKTGKFVFSRAGHNPLLLLIGQADNGKWLTPPGIGIGLSSDEKFKAAMREETIQLKPGDSIILYTDGYPEAMNDKLEEYQEQQLKTLIEENRKLTAKQIIDILEKSIIAWQGKQPPFDDRTIVVIKRTA